MTMISFWEKNIFGPEYIHMIQ